MAKPDSLPVGRYFLALALIFVLLYTIVFWPGHKHTPKLGLDLVGGTQIIFTARTPTGGTPSSSSMSQAKEIIEERVNGTGVTEATVVIQGSDQIVVSIPGDTNVQPSSLGATANLNFRGVVTAPVPVACLPKSVASAATSSAKPSSSASAHSGDSVDARQLAGPHAASTPTAAGGGAAASASPGSSPAATPSGSASGSAAGSASGSTSATPTAPASSGSTSTSVPVCTLTSVAQLKKLVKDLPAPSSLGVNGRWKPNLAQTPVYKSNGLSAAVSTEVAAALANYDCDATQNEPDRVGDYYLVCDDGTNAGTPLAFLLGPVVVPGTEISSASALAANVQQGQTLPSVQLTLKTSGQKAWANYTAKHNVGGATPSSGIDACGSSATPCTDYVAFTLDGKVISNPYNESAINGGNTQISGNFTQASAEQLAQQLKYGALPLKFKNDTSQTISATLGTSQLKAGMLAGGIGLALVVLYSLLYYRALGLVTIASLLVSGGLVYGSIVMLGKQMGFTLSLAGIAGFIVAVGITTDSFVVFFERIKDEVHEGRSVRVAIPRAWVRARRTILSADTVSVLAAAILYYFAAGDVKGFAFTLGLSTILDIAVVFLFTHPLMSLLSRMRAFGTGKFTGLAHIRDGMVVTASSGSRASDTRRARRGRGDAARADDEAAGRAGVRLDKSAVATLEGEPGDADDSGADGADDSAASGEDAATPTPPRTEPAAGSAAERAAQRRARMREKGES